MLTQPITTKDLYRKLVKGFPSLTLKQITFTGGASSVEKLGDFLADVALPGLTAPVQIKFRIQKMATPGVGTGVVSAVQQKVAAAPPAQSQSIKA